MAQKGTKRDKEAQTITKDDIGDASDVIVVDNEDIVDYEPVFEDDGVPMLDKGEYDNTPIIVTRYEPRFSHENGDGVMIYIIDKNGNEGKLLFWSEYIVKQMEHFPKDRKFRMQYRARTSRGGNEYHAIIPIKKE